MTVGQCANIEDLNWEWPWIMSNVGMRMHNRIFCAYAYSTMLCIYFMYNAHMIAIPHIHVLRAMLHQLKAYMRNSVGDPCVVCKSGHLKEFCSSWAPAATFASLR